MLFTPGDRPPHHAERHPTRRFLTSSFRAVVAGSLVVSCASTPRPEAEVVEHGVVASGPRVQQCPPHELHLTPEREAERRDQIAAHMHDTTRAIVLQAGLDEYCSQYFCPRTLHEAIALGAPCDAVRAPRVALSCNGYRQVVWGGVDSSYSWYFDERTERLAGHQSGGATLVERWGDGPASLSGCM
jgi:hypothetical protein